MNDFKVGDIYIRNDCRDMKYNLMFAKPEFNKLMITHVSRTTICYNLHVIVVASLSGETVDVFSDFLLAFWVKCVY